jgi:hypothetical protein
MKNLNIKESLIKELIECLLRYIENDKQCYCENDFECPKHQGERLIKLFINNNKKAV